MPLVKDTWHTATFNALSSWTNPIPTLAGWILDAIDQNTTVYVYCSDDTVDDGASAVIHWHTGTVAGSAVVQQAGVSVITDPTMELTTWADGDVWRSIRIGVALQAYSTRSESVKRLADSSSFGAFAS